MRLKLTCNQCTIEALSNNIDEFNSSLFEKFNILFRDDGCYEFTCHSGHKTTTILQQQKFEILFEIGAHAILDGYYREAVSSFTASLERFYEFSIRILLEESTGSDYLFQSIWKSVSSQSERQLGAFIFLWANRFKSPAEILPQKMIQFRNEVIHKGKIPTRTEAIKYGDSVLECIKPKLKILHENFEEQIFNSVSRHIQECRNANSNQTSVSTTAINTIISLLSQDKSYYDKTLEEHLTFLDEIKKIY